MRGLSRNVQKPESAEAGRKRNIERDLEAVKVAEFSGSKGG
jgi:hypothetical protein